MRCHDRACGGSAAKHGDATNGDFARKAAFLFDSHDNDDVRMRMRRVSLTGAFMKLSLEICPLP